ncbi:transposase [Ideonella sp. DXS22W]|uniref:Transposase n=1 Tax=Pseudaquabacterium inlustre TaxID=2984192 RepID=A0ABU9CNM5_9BURK
MARLPRLAVPGLAHLVTLAGHNQQPVFVDDEDRRAFLAALREAAVPRRVAVLGWALADAHVHLLLRPEAAADLSGAMQALGRRYVAGFNHRHGRSGTLWAGRYRAAVVQPGEPLLEAMLFLDTHALRAGSVAAPEDDVWSSVRAHLGLARDALLTEGPDWWALGNTPFEREAAWRRRIDEGLSLARAVALGTASRGGWALGDAAFLAALAEQGDRPLQPRRRGRPARPPVP